MFSNISIQELELIHANIIYQVSDDYREVSSHLKLFQKEKKKKQHYFCFFSFKKICSNILEKIIKERLMLKLSTDLFPFSLPKRL